MKYSKSVSLPGNLFFGDVNAGKFAFAREEGIEGKVGSFRSQRFEFFQKDRFFTVAGGVGKMNVPVIIFIHCPKL